jgi:hypothetical protein
MDPRATKRWRMNKAVTFTIPEQLDTLLHARVKRGRMSQYVTQALWKALEEDENALLKEFLDADKDAGNLEAKADFSGLEGEDFAGIEDFDDEFGENLNK